MSVYLHIMKPGLLIKTDKQKRLNRQKQAVYQGKRNYVYC